MYSKNWIDNVLAVPDIDNDYIYITVKIGSKIEGNLFEEAKKMAVLHCINFYSLEYSKEVYEKFSKEDTTVKEWFMVPNLNSEPKVLIQINKNKFYEIFNTKKQQIVTNLENKQFQILVQNEIQAVFSFIIEKIREYDRDYKEWKRYTEKTILDIPMVDNQTFSMSSNFGSVNISTIFKPELVIRDLNSLKKTLLDYISNNNIDKKEEIVLIYKDDKKEKIEQVGTRNFIFDIGSNYFLKIINNNKQILKILFDVGKKPNNEYYLKNSNNFQEFLESYYLPTVSNFLFQEESVRNTYIKLQKGLDNIKNFSKSFTVPGTTSRINLGAKVKKSRDREKLSDPIVDNIVFNMQVTYPDLDTLEQVQNHIINKISIKEIIDIIMRCFGIYNFKLPRFDFQIPEIPMINIYDIYLYLSINFEDIFLQIMKKVIDKLFDYLFGLLRRICEDAWKPDAKSFPNLDLSEVSYPNYSDALKSFIKEVFDSLTAIQICGLLNGEPTKETLDIINNILAKPLYKEIKENILKSESDIILFFSNLGDVIDKTVFCDIGDSQDNTLDPCMAVDSVNNLYKQLYKDNHNLSDEEIEKLNESRIQAIDDLKNEIYNLTATFEEFPQQIQESINNFEVEIPSRKNEDIYSQTYNQTVKLASGKSYEDFVNKLSGINSNNSYDLVMQSRIPLTTLKQIPELNYTGNSYTRKILDELYKNNPHQNGNFNLSNFIPNVNLDIESFLKTLYSSSNKKTVSQIKGENVLEKQILILDNSLKILELYKWLLLTNPLAKQISFSYKFDNSLYTRFYNESPSVVKLEDLLSSEDKLEVARVKYEEISNYFVGINSSLDEYKKLDNLIAEIQKVKDGLI